MEKDKRLRLRRLDVHESGIPGYLMAKGYDEEHVRRALKRYFIEAYGLDEDVAERLAGRTKISPPKRISEEEAKAYLKRIHEEYDVRLDIKNRKYLINAENKKQAKVKFQRFLEEEWILTPEEATEIAEDVKERKKD